MIKILVVDNDAVVCEQIKKTFSYIGFTVFTATKTALALQLLKREKPKIVFLDILMPDDPGGFGLLERMKAIDPEVVVIAISEQKEDFLRQRALELGAVDFITTPFSHNYLRDLAVQKVKELLDKGGHIERPRILIVDDEEGLRSSLVTFISRKFDCELAEAGDGVAAVEKVREWQPDLVLLDIKMPGLNGIAAIAEMLRFSPDSKIVVVSAWKSLEVVNKAIQAGAIDYIAKPLSLPVVYEKIKSFLILIGKLILKKETP